MLKFYVRHGMVVEKIHEIISFKQSKWLESYNSFNTQKRNKAKNDFEKDFFKLLVNAENHEVFSERNKKVIGKFKIETPKSFWIDEFVCLRSKAYSFKCKNNDENKNKIKGISKSQSKHLNFKEFYNCLFGGEYQRECNNYIIRSINHEMILQEVTKPTSSIFHDKRCYINKSEGKPWKC